MTAKWTVITGLMLVLSILPASAIQAQPADRTSETRERATPLSPPTVLLPGLKPHDPHGPHLPPAPLPVVAPPLSPPSVPVPEMINPRTAGPTENRAEDGCALPTDLPAKARAPIAEGRSARVLSDAYLRAGPGCGARVLDVLAAGETVVIMGSKGNWYRVGRKGAVLGYVGGALLVETGRR